MLKNMCIELDNKEFCSLMKALSSPVRVDILKLLSKNSLNINEIADTLNIPISTAAVNVKILEDADLIMSALQSGKRGSIKLCSIKYEELHVNMVGNSNSISFPPFFAQMPVGCYSNCEVHPPCGIANEVHFIGKDDNTESFYNTERFEAQLLWFFKGFVEYRFPRDSMSLKEITNIEFSLEICSEAPNYRNQWPSDITVWVNEKEIGTWTCPGDFGGRRGNLTPNWWPLNSTQFGVLKTWSITPSGSYIDRKRLSNVNLEQLNMDKYDYISFKIGVKRDAHNIGGINIFGEKFGDFSQNINMRIDYKQN